MALVGSSLIQNGHNPVPYCLFTTNWICAIIESEKENKSKILYSTTLRNAAPTEQICKKLLQNMIAAPELEAFKDTILLLLNKWETYFTTDREDEE